MTVHAPELVAEGFTFLEGPRWRDGRLFVSDFYSGRVLAFDKAGRYETLCEVPGQPSGLGFARDGSLLIVSMIERRLLRLHDGRLDEVADLTDLAPGLCNDMVVDENGRAYIGNFGAPNDDDPDRIPTTRLIRVDDDGSVHVAAEGLVFPNGTVIAPDGRTLFIAETLAGRITAFDTVANGGLSNRRVWAGFGDPGTTFEEAVHSGVALPDGMALDAEGALWVGDAAGHGALRVARGGAVIDAVDTGHLTVYAVCLGDEDRRTLYLCAAPPLGAGGAAGEGRSALFRARVDAPGVGIP